ncbi:Uncharacterised protein [uncultured archaeon]|nr:Uncharacterised protein [uncultured archaeon]
MEFELLRMLIAVAGTGAAAYYDVFNRKNVPDMLLYAFLGIAVVVNIFDPSAFLQNLPIAAVMIGSMYFLYRIGQLGGADVLVLAAIYASIPVVSGPLLGTQEDTIFSQFQMPSILVVTSIAVLLFAIWIVVRYAPDALRRTFRGEVKFSAMQLGQSFMLLLSFGAFVYMFSQLPTFSVNLIALMEILFVSAIFFTLYKDVIMGSMVKWTRRPEREDVLAVELLDSRLISRHSIGRLVDKGQLKRMSKLRRKWPVLDLPMFLPYVLVALVIYILFGNQLLYSMF